MNLLLLLLLTAKLCQSQICMSDDSSRNTRSSHICCVTGKAGKETGKKFITIRVGIVKS